MHVTFANRGIVQIDDARIIYRNFRGEGSRFNREGDRDFCVVIPDPEIAEALQNDLSKDGAGWNVKVKAPKEEGDTPFMFLKVKVHFNDRGGPAIYLKTGDNMIRLDKEDVDCLDRMDIARVDLDIRPYDDIINGKPFRSAYLQSMCVTQDLSRDRFAARYAEANDDDTLPY